MSPSNHENRRVWDPSTGECLHVLPHNHIVKAVSFPIQKSPPSVATGGQEKKLRIFDLTTGAMTRSSDHSPTTPSSNATGWEVGAGEHTASIKSIVWNVDYNILTTAADDKTVRWWDLRTQRMIAHLKTERDITSCELSTNHDGDINPGILSVAAGHSCYFLDAGRPGEIIKKVNFDHDIASVAINPTIRKFVTGGSKDTWVRVWDFDQEKELGKKSPLPAEPIEANILQKYSRVIMVLYGPQRSHLMARYMPPVVKTERSNYGRHVKNRMVFGGEQMSGCRRMPLAAHDRFERGVLR